MKSSQNEPIGNIDPKTVQGFGEEWSYYDQIPLSSTELQEQFDRYFSCFPWEKLAKNAVGFDMGCGSGRWAALVASRVEKLYCIDASEKALEICKKRLGSLGNTEVMLGTFDAFPLPDSSMDFGYSLGVLHHVPNTQLALNVCVRKLKPGAPFLLYLYYALDNRPRWFKVLWKISDLFRKLICHLPFTLKKSITSIIAAVIYFPLSRVAKIMDCVGISIKNFPLAHYRNHSFYTMCTDALDRLGTRLEHRFARVEILEMMEKADLEHIVFSDKEPYWCAVGIKRDA